MAGQFIYYKLLKPEATMTVYEHGARFMPRRFAGIGDPRRSIMEIPETVLPRAEPKGYLELFEATVSVKKCAGEGIAHLQEARYRRRRVRLGSGTCRAGGIYGMVNGRRAESRWGDLPALFFLKGLIYFFAFDCENIFKSNRLAVCQNNNAVALIYSLYLTHYSYIKATFLFCIGNKASDRCGGALR